MCGIVGVVSRDPSMRDATVVASMVASLRHRGPDDEGIAHLGDAAIGVRRLSIIDVAGGHQPMSNEDGSVIAVQNGEIYEFASIRDELIAKGHLLRTRSDTEILPHGWEEWRDELVPRLVGMFAVAVWDQREQRLLLARDRFGKKPLLYAQVGPALVFGSEIQSLLAHPAVDRSIDDLAIDDYLTFGYIPAPRTAFSAIRKLPPAHLLTWKDGEVALRRYWRPRFEPKLDIGRDEAEEELRRLIDVAVRRRLISDVPLGAFLSGGLDSSTVVAYMARHSDRPVKTFSVGFTDAWYDESRYARVVAHAFGTDHTEFRVDAGDVDVLPMLVRHVGEPFADSSIVPTYHIARVTRPHVTVALTGDGGDELFAGYGRYRAATIAATIPAALRSAAASIARLLPQHTAAPRALPRARRFLVGLGLRSEMRHLTWTGYFTGDLRGAIAGDRLQGGGSALAGAQLGAAAEITGAEHIAERYMASDILWYLADDLLVKMDIATMAASLEARSPLLDHDLHEFVARLPVGLKLSWTTSKRLLRSAMRGILPDTILDRRRKMGFTAPVGAWLRGPLRDLSADVLLSSRAAAEGYVSESGVRRLFDEHMRGTVDRTMQVWSLLMLELWMREVAGASARVRIAAPTH